MRKSISWFRPWLTPLALIGLALLLTVPWCYFVIKATYDRDVTENAKALARRVEQQFKIASVTAAPRRSPAWTLLDDPAFGRPDPLLELDFKLRRTLGAEMRSDPTVESVVFYTFLYADRRETAQPEAAQFLAIVRDPTKEVERLTKEQIQTLSRGGIIRKDDDPSSIQFLVPWKQDNRIAGATFVQLSRQAVTKDFWQKELPLLLQVVAWTACGVLTLSAIGIFAWRAWQKAGRVQLRAELAHQGLLAERGLTAAVLAHEIRNPLAALRFQLHSLRKNAANPDRTTSTAETIDSELSRIQQLVTDYLEHEKAISLRVQSVDLEDAARKLQSLLVELLRQTRTELIITPPLEPVYAACDPHALRQILMNLVLNAQQAMGQDGTIFIRIGRDADFGTIDVIDTGPGIPEEIRARLFKPFQTSKKEGHGIGLALVKRFVDNFGGSVTVESQAGKGTTFHLRLPIADQRGTEAAIPAEPLNVTMESGSGETKNQ